MTQAHETHPTRRVHQQVRSALQRRLQRAVDTVAPATARDPRAGARAGSGTIRASTASAPGPSRRSAAQPSDWSVSAARP